MSYNCVIRTRNNVGTMSVENNSYGLSKSGCVITGIRRDFEWFPFVRHPILKFENSIAVFLMIEQYWIGGKKRYFPILESGCSRVNRG